MLMAASVCPHPPALMPAVSGATPQWLAQLREICAASVRRLTASGAEHIVAVGAAKQAGRWGHTAGGSLRGFGVPTVSGGPDVVLPLSLTIAAHLLDEAGWAGRRSYVAVPAGQGRDESAQLGRELVTGRDRVALLVMGDGSAKRSTDAPGYLDERAQAFDAAVVTALRDVDPHPLLAVESGLANELWVAGRESWQVLAGAAQAILDAQPAAAEDRQRPLVAEVRYDDAPLGVGYFVVDWTVEPPR